jgi:hypothetical protein
MRPRRCRITIGGERSKTSTPGRTGTNTMLTAPSQAGGWEPESPRGQGTGAVRAAAGWPCLRLTCRQGWPGRREPGGGCGGGRGRCLGVEAAVTACGDAELDDARGARDHDQEHAEEGGAQKDDTERQVAVCADVADGHALAVFQDEGSAAGAGRRRTARRRPRSADACPPDHVGRGPGCARAWFAGAAVPEGGGRLGSACWLRCHGPHLPSSYVAFTFPCLLRLGARQGGRYARRWRGRLGNGADHWG